MEVILWRFFWRRLVVDVLVRLLVDILVRFAMNVLVGFMSDFLVGFKREVMEEVLWRFKIVVLRWFVVDVLFHHKDPVAVVLDFSVGGN